MLPAQEFATKLNATLKEGNLKAASILVVGLIKDLNKSNEVFDAKAAAAIMLMLQKKRMFPLVLQLGDALMQTGRSAAGVQQRYAQALIDTGCYSAAIAVLNDLIAITKNASDNSNSFYYEAMGLCGRVHKQLYVNAPMPDVPHARAHLLQAIDFYLQVYTSNKNFTWHGINAVALLKRALRDEVDVSGMAPPDKLAGEILQTIQGKVNDATADAWDFATAAEACVALNRPNEALEWLSGYARMPYCDAFEIASTLRQLKEVWQLDFDTPMGKLLLPICRAELLKREGAEIKMDAADIQQMKAAEKTITAVYENSIEKQDSKKGAVVLEKVFGDDSFKTYKWYMQGADRCLAVARIGRDSSKGFGTGFLLRGEDIHENLAGELLLLTNAHVLSNDANETSMRPHEAVVIFEALNRDEEFRLGEIVWSSPSTALDVTIVRFSKNDLIRLRQVTEKVKLFSVSKYLPELAPDNPQRVYVIGHPFGGTMQLSFLDNTLLDYEDPKIHYRTPTEGGSSGSPLFNQQWDLIGLHHAGADDMPCLNGKPGTYAANEGIWIEAIKTKIFT